MSTHDDFRPDTPGIVSGMASESRQFPWSLAEENCLYRIVHSENLSGRTTTEAWSRIAGRLATEWGFPLRSASSVRHRATKIRAYSRDRNQTPEPVVVTAPPATLGQATFAAPEIRSLIADAFERACSAIVKELRGT